MIWFDIAGIMFVCVTMNHLGLVKAIEDEIEKALPVINCPKCSVFWAVLLYTSITTKQLIMSLAISFLASYVALWLELFEGFIDTLYMKLYGKIYTTDDNTASADSDDGNSASTVP